VANLSAGGLRNYNLIDVLATLNGDGDAGNDPDLTIDESYTLLASASETARLRDIYDGGSVVVTAVTNGTWGSDTRGWGLSVWNA
jgi:hypothetical protein